ncbi:MAG TPA: SRPBCC family protein [Candidatus Acidoferrum sp.]
MKWILWIVLTIVTLAILVTLIGWLLPVKHVASRTGFYKEPPEAVWQAITNIEAMPSWRKGLKSVERLPDHDGLPAWVEHNSDGTMPMQTVEREPPKRLVVRIADPKLSFGGTWTYEITPAAGGSALRITENGEVYNPFFRFVSRFVIGENRTIEDYLTSLAGKLGDVPRIGK